MYDRYAVIFGIIALVCWSLSIQGKSKKSILKLQTIANGFYCIQYILLGAVSAGCMNLVSVIRCIVFYKYEEKHIKAPKLVLLVFIAILAIIALFTYDGIFSMIPIAITMGYAYSMWQTNLNIVRIIYIAAAIVWIYYNYSVGAYASLIGNIIEIISGSISLIRNKKHQ